MRHHHPCPKKKKMIDRYEKKNIRRKYVKGVICYDARCADGQMTPSTPLRFTVI